MPNKYKDQSENYISFLTGPRIIHKTQPVIPSGAQLHRRLTTYIHTTLCVIWGDVFVIGYSGKGTI
jgi:hypothetical protein